jgi:hypothetical protein
MFMMVCHPQERFVPKERSVMRKHVATLFAAAALVGAALPVAASVPASAASFSCQPVSHSYTVSQEKVAVHATPSPRGSVVGYKYKDNKVHTDFACSNSTGDWVCIGQCHVDEESITGRWVFRNYLKG